MARLEDANRAGPTKPVLVLCEGRSDAYFFDALAQDRDMEDIGVNWPDPKHLGTDSGGISAYPTWLDGIVTRTGFRQNVRTLVITADNDDDDRRNFDTVQRNLRDAGFVAPATPQTFATQDQLRVAILMLPATGRPGCLETLLLESCSWENAKKECLTTYCECTEEMNGWSVSQRDKARLACVLAASMKKLRSAAYIWNKPDNPLTIGHDCFDDVADFLRGCC